MFQTLRKLKGSFEPCFLSHVCVVITHKIGLFLLLSYFSFLKNVLKRETPECFESKHVCITFLN